jgi:hypothetical protein
MHDGGAGGGGGHIPAGGHMPAHHPGQFSHAPAQHHHGHDGPVPAGYDQSGSMAGITSSGRLSRQARAAGISVMAVFMIIFIVLLII